MSISVTRINITPIKGTALQHPQLVKLDDTGVFANRRFHLIDHNGTMINGKRQGRLVQLQSDYDTDTQRLAITFPDGARLEGQVQLTDKTVETSFYGRPVPGVVTNDLWNDAISALAGSDLRLVYVAPDTIGTDVHPVTLISRATMDLILERAGGPAQHWADRFRMLFELEGPDAFQEDTWLGRRVAIGDAIVRVVGPVPRCVVTAQDPTTGERNFDTLRALHDIRGERRQRLSTPTDHLPDGGKLLLGMYAVVEQHGNAWVGCPVEILN